MCRNIENKQEISKPEGKICLTPSLTGITVDIVIKFSTSSRKDSTKNLFPFKPNPCPYFSQGEMLLELHRQDQEKHWLIYCQFSDIFKIKREFRRDKDPFPSLWLLLGSWPGKSISKLKHLENLWELEWLHVMEANLFKIKLLISSKELNLWSAPQVAW